MSHDLQISLPHLTLALGVLFLASGAGWILFPREGFSTFHVAFGLAAAFVNIALATALRRWTLPLRWTHPVGFADGVLVLAHALMLFGITSDPLQATPVALLVIGAGFFLHLIGWWVALVGLCVVGAAIVTALTPDPAWLYLVSMLTVSVVISTAVYLQRVRALRQLVGLRLAEQGQQAQLELALRLASQAQRALQTSVGVAQHITSILDIETLLSQVARLIQEHYGYEHIGVYLLAQSGAELEQRASAGVARKDAFGGETSIALDAAAPVAQAARDRGVVLLDHEESGLELAVPLEVAGDLVGVLYVQARCGDLSGDGDVDVVKSLAGQIAVAIKNATRYQAERTRRLFAEKLVDVGRALSRVLDLDAVFYLILKQVADIVPHDRGSILLQSEDG